MSERILVVDDEPDLLELVRLNLSQAGFAVDTAKSGAEAMKSLEAARPDLMVLDLMLPDVSGTELCRRLRSDRAFAELPILMLTARADEVDRVVGFELGADDYVTKPFSPRELVLRIRAILRRRKPSSTESDTLGHAGLQLDLARHRCFVDAAEVDLTAKEFELLSELMRQPGRVMSRDRLLDRVWGSDISVTTRTIDTHVKRLREKLGDCGDLIETVRGIGYRFAE